MLEIGYKCQGSRYFILYLMLVNESMEIMRNYFAQYNLAIIGCFQRTRLIGNEISIRHSNFKKKKAHCDEVN